MDTDINGRAKVTKLGFKEITREGFEYELSVNFELINDKHLAKASKDRTGLFMDKPEFVINKATGKKLIAWCNEGVSIEEAKLEINEATTLDGLKHIYSKYASIQEQIQIEEIDRVTHPNDESDVQSLSIEQIDLISEYLGEELHKNRKAPLKSQDRNIAIQLRDIALKIGNNKETTLDDAIHLMAIAQSIIPESAFISNTIENWKIALHRMRITSQK